MVSVTMMTIQKRRFKQLYNDPLLILIIRLLIHFYALIPTLILTQYFPPKSSFYKLVPLQFDDVTRNKTGFKRIGFQFIPIFILRR